MLCCKKKHETKEGETDESIIYDVPYSQMFFKTLSRDYSALSILVRAKQKLKKHTQNNENIPTLFSKIAKEYPDKTAIVLVDGKTWTFKEIDNYSDSLAIYLQKNGFSKDDVVAIYMDNIPELAIFWLGLSKIGVVGSLINNNLIGPSLLHCISISGAKAIIYSGERASALRDIKEDLPQGMKAFCYDDYDSSVFVAIHLNPELNKNSSKITLTRPENRSFNDTLFHIYTSGTTGLPKAAIVTHTRYYWSSFLMSKYVGLTKDSVIYDTLPLYHSAGGILGIGMSYLVGATVVVRRKFSASNFWKDCIKYNCTDIQYIGEMCRYLIMQPPKKTDTEHTVQRMYGNGFRQQIWKPFVDRFNIKNVREFYGATEGNCNIINTTNKVGAVGFCSLIAPWAYPISLIQVDSKTGEPIRDDKGLCIKCKPGQLGEMVGQIIKSDSTRNFDGYLDKEASKKKITKNVFSQGDQAFLTGDLMVMDGLGYCYFRDRTGDTFRWKGENVSTSEVESTISSIVKLNDTVVFGVEIPGTEGKAGMAAIVDEGKDINLEHLNSELQKALPVYARPVFIRLLQSSQANITSTFKLQKSEYAKDGFDPSKMKDDKLYYIDWKQNQYKELTDAVFEEINNNKIKL